MPVMSGLELARILRTEAELCSIPILAVSASASSYTREEALEAGCNEFLAKPVHAEELLDVIGTLLKVTWETVEVTNGPPDEPEPESLEGVVVDTVWAEELYDLAMQGDVKELVSRAGQAASDDPAGAPLYREIQRLARTYDLKGVRKVLREAREVRT
jgi:CheY-like chemotaxis protein